MTTVTIDPRAPFVLFGALIAITVGMLVIGRAARKGPRPALEATINVSLLMLLAAVAAGVILAKTAP